METVESIAGAMKKAPAYCFDTQCTIKLDWWKMTEVKHESERLIMSGLQ